MFAGPVDQDIEWSDQNIIGVSRFINKFWNNQDRIKDMIHIPDVKSETIAREKIETMKSRIVQVYEGSYRFNTIIAFSMEVFNAISKTSDPQIWREGYDVIIEAIDPIAPHICSEMKSNM